MKKLLALLTLGAATAAPAYAGLGVTASLGATNDGLALGVMAPTLDYRGGGWLVQLHAFDLIGELPNGFLDFGFDVTGIAIKKKVGDDVDGVFMPGGAFTLHTDTGFGSVGWQALAQARFGAEMKQKMGFGIYVVPVLGASNLTGNVGIAYGGTVQVSVWFTESSDGGDDDDSRGSPGDGNGDGRNKGKGKGK